MWQLLFVSAHDNMSSASNLYAQLSIVALISVSAAAFSGVTCLSCLAAYSEEAEKLLSCAPAQQPSSSNLSQPACLSLSSMRGSA